MQQEMSCENNRETEVIPCPPSHLMLLKRGGWWFSKPGGYHDSGSVSPKWSHKSRARTVKIGKYRSKFRNSMGKALIFERGPQGIHMHLIG